MTNIRSFFSSLIAALALTAAGGAQANNVALGKPVTLNEGSVLGASLATLTDGLFVGTGTYYQSGTVYWALPEAPLFEVNLGGLYQISSVTLEHDNNDVYLILYPLGGGIGSKSIFSPNSGGMATNTVTFSTPITASRLSILGAGGDGLYSLSEIQVSGVAVVPEPGTYGMMFAGLALMGGVIARRRKAAPAA